MNRLKITVAALAMLIGGMSANAATMLIANLTNGQENPPTVPTTTGGLPRPVSFGYAELLLNDAMTALTYNVTVFNLDFTGTQTADVNDNLGAAHIHAGPNVTPLTNGPVVFGFIGMPFNETVSNDVVVTPFVNGVGGTVSGKWDAAEGQNTTLAAQIGNILGGRAYLNFHTTQFPGGEIRGALVSVPEPSSIVLIGAGLSALALLRRRAR